MVRIAIDPGHGGRDPGAVANGLREADVALDVALAAALREKHGAEVLLTREADAYVPLRERVRRANAWGADLFVSVHANAGGGAGFESYRCPGAPERTRLLHAAVHRELAAFFARHGRPDRGAKLRRFYVLRATRMPAVLLECLFLDDPDDAALLAQADFRRKLGEAIAAAVAGALGAGGNGGVAAPGPGRTGR